LVLREFKVHKENVVRQDIRVHQVNKVQEDLKDLQAQLVQEGRQVHQVIKVLQECLKKIK
jgi:hypothetical protein